MRAQSARCHAPAPACRMARQLGRLVQLAVAVAVEASPYPARQATAECCWGHAVSAEHMCSCLVPPAAAQWDQPAVAPGRLRHLEVLVLLLLVLGCPRRLQVPLLVTTCTGSSSNKACRTTATQTAMGSLAASSTSSSLVLQQQHQPATTRPWHREGGLQNQVQTFGSLAALLAHPAGRWMHSPVQGGSGTVAGAQAAAAQGSSNTSTTSSRRGPTSCVHTPMSSSWLPAWLVSTGVQTISSSPAS